MKLDHCTVEYAQGHAAYQDADVECPYANGSEGARLWWAGWGGAFEDYARRVKLEALAK